MQTYQLLEIAKLINAEIKGSADAIINGVASIFNAQQSQITYLIGGKYKKHLAETKAGAVILNEKFADLCTTSALVVANPELAFTKVARLFQRPLTISPGIHSTATVADDATIDTTAAISANCVIGRNVNIGSGTVIMPGTVIGENTSIGSNCIIYSNVTIYHDIQIANRVIINSGAVIGADGFGYTQDNGQWVKIPQLGRVLIEDDVEIGACTAVDRGALEDTIIRCGVKIDNLVQIGHNVEIGEHTIIAGCVGISGSTKIGKHCMVGGGGCITGHITIADHVMLGGMTGVDRSITEPGVYSSATVAHDHRQWLKNRIHFMELNKLVKRVKKLEAYHHE